MGPSIVKPSSIKREFIRKFANNIKLSVFQKEHLTLLISSIRADYEVGLKFSNFIKNNQAYIESFVNDLDTESKNEVKVILTNLEFINTHTLYETIEEFIMKGDKVLEHMTFMESIKKKYPLPVNIYEESIFKYKHGLKFLPQDIIKSLNNKVFLDCGAYVGDSALMFIRDYNPSKVYSFEPIIGNYNNLLVNIENNNLKNLIPINKGLGEKSYILNIHSLDVSSFISEAGDAKINVISIDEFVSENDLSVGLIKMDVEGYELEALRGAKNTIKDFKPLLLIGIYHNPEEFFGTKKYLEKLMPDYQFKIKFLSDIRPLAEIHLIAWCEPQS
jgi:FkbM family methyltransferase